MDEAAVKAALSPDKDVDGVHEVNAGRLAMVAPAGRPAGVGPFFVRPPGRGMELMRRYGVKFAGKHAVVVGRSSIVGKPMAMLLMRRMRPSRSATRARTTWPACAGRGISCARRWGERG